MPVATAGRAGGAAGAGMQGLLGSSYRPATLRFLGELACVLMRGSCTGLCAAQPAMQPWGQHLARLSGNATNAKALLVI